jgi:hypothetical protein
VVKNSERQLYRLEEVLACSQDWLSSVGLQFPLPVELCSMKAGGKQILNMGDKFLRNAG